MEEQRGAVASTINVKVQMSAGIPYLERSSAHMLFGNKLNTHRQREITKCLKFQIQIYFGSHTWKDQVLTWSGRGILPDGDFLP